MFLGTEPAPLKQQAQLRSRKSPNPTHHPVERETLAIRLRRQMTARCTRMDAALSSQHDERVDAEHGRAAAVGVMFVVVQRSSDPVPAAVKGGEVTQGALALPEHNLQQSMLGSSGRVSTVVLKLGPLLGQFVRVGDEVAVGDDAANVVVTQVPVSGPGYWRSGHFFFLLKRESWVLCEDCRFWLSSVAMWAFCGFGVVGSVESGKGENDFKGSWCVERDLSKRKPPLGGNKSSRNLTLSVRKVLAGSVNGMCECLHESFLIKV